MSLMAYKASLQILLKLFLQHVSEIGSESFNKIISLSQRNWGWKK